MDKSIEAAARAVFQEEWPNRSWDRLTEGVRAQWIDNARAAIAAYRDAEIERLTAERDALKSARDFTPDERESWEAFLREFFETGEINVENAALRAKLEAAERVIGYIATLSHYGGLRNMSEREVLRDIRRLCLDRMVTSGSMEEHGVRLKAAIDAARGGERG